MQAGNYTCTLANPAGTDAITYSLEVRASRSNGVVPVPPSPSLASSTSSSLQVTIHPSPLLTTIPPSPPSCPGGVTLTEEPLSPPTPSTPAESSPAGSASPSPPPPGPPPSLDSSNQFAHESPLHTGEVT